jgi:hypothetical protein
MKIIFPSNKNFPSHAKIVSGHWNDRRGFGLVWCKIQQVYDGRLSLKHPKLGTFAWVDINDCILGYKNK